MKLTLAVIIAPIAERDDSPDERVAAVSGEQWRRREVVLYKR